MAIRKDSGMPAQPDRESDSMSDDRLTGHAEEEKIRGVGESDDDEFEDIEDLEEDDEEDDNI